MQWLESFLLTTCGKHGMVVVSAGRCIVMGERGRPRKEVDGETLYDLAVRGMTKKDQAEELGITVPTLNARIAEIQKKQGLILQYRALQNIQLTEIQARILEAITPEKIEEASLRDLVTSYKILKDKELVDTGKATDVKGIMHYLIQMEKEEAALEAEVLSDGEEIDDVASREDLSEYIPDL